MDIDSQKYPLPPAPPSHDSEEVRTATLFRSVSIILDKFASQQRDSLLGHIRQGGQCLKAQQNVPSSEIEAVLEAMSPSRKCKPSQARADGVHILLQRGKRNDTDCTACEGFKEEGPMY